MYKKNLLNIKETMLNIDNVKIALNKKHMMDNINLE